MSIKMEGNSVASCSHTGTGIEHSCELLQQLSLDSHGGAEVKNLGKVHESYICAICHEHIKHAETAQIKGCEHEYCVTCILCWATYKKEPWCPQCRLPFSFLYVYRALDGSLADYLFEESVCLLLRASWFKPLTFQEQDEPEEYQDEYDYDEYYSTANVRLGNRRWGDTGYVRTGRREARPVGVRQVINSIGSGSSSKVNEPKQPIGRRARRAQKREQLDKERQS